MNWDMVFACLLALGLFTGLILALLVLACSVDQRDRR